MRPLQGLRAVLRELAREAEVCPSSEARSKACCGGRTTARFGRGAPPGQKPDAGRLKGTPLTRDDRRLKEAERKLDQLMRENEVRQQRPQVRRSTATVPRGVLVSGLMREAF